MFRTPLWYIFEVDIPVEEIAVTREEFKSIMEMVVLIIEKSKDKDEALKDIKGLTILKGEKEA